MSNKEKGLIFNIQRFSLHDGPGIRTTIFFKGCPLNCLWCHNPEGIKQKKELFFKSFNCNVCKNCIDKCHQGVISIQKENLKIAREKCDFCGVCVETCQNNALEICGKYMTTQEIINEILRDRKFYENSNGGITLSGGEPLIQFEFIISLLKEMKELDLHTALDTSGYIKHDRFTRILDLIDLILFDVKTLDPSRHKDLTGVSNERILKNLKLCLNHPIETIIRIPVIYGYNFIDLQKELTKQILELEELGFSQFQLIPYHKFGEQKYQMLGESYSIEMESNQFEKIKDIAHQLKAKINIDIDIVEPILT